MGGRVDAVNMLFLPSGKLPEHAGVQMVWRPAGRH